MNTFISVDVTHELKAQLKAIAKRNGVPMSYVVRIGLEAGLPMVNESLARLRSGVAAARAAATAEAKAS